MSLPVSIGDILAVSKLAHDVWCRLRDASDQFKAIRSDLRGLHIVLDDAAEGLSGLELDQKETVRLASLLEVLENILKDTNAVLEKFEGLDTKSSSLGAMKRKTWKKATWDEESIQDLRARINLNTGYLTTLTTRLANKTAQSIKDNVIILDGRVQDLHLHNLDQERRKILDWISPLDFPSQQSAIFGQRQEGTGEWLLESREFMDWMSKDRGTLLCIGMPGSGKTMLASIAIDYLLDVFHNQQDIGVAYIYCDYTVQTVQTPLSLLSCLLKQLLQQKPLVPENIRMLHAQHKSGNETTRPTLDKVFILLQQMVASFSRVYVVVDALDELQQFRNTLQVLISRLCALQSANNVNLMMTARDLPNVVEEVQSAVRLEVRARDEDVQTYVDGHMNELRKFVSRDAKLQRTIKDIMVSAVDGMFLLARLHLESLKDKMNPSELRLALEALPRGGEALSVAYDQAMLRIEAQKPGARNLALKAMSWITYAERLLTASELRYALGIQHGALGFNDDNLSDLDDIVSACGGLVTVDRGQDVYTVRLVHYTTQEFLRQSGETYFPNARQNISCSCLTYLLYDDFDGGDSKYCSNEADSVKQNKDVEDIVQLHPFLLYAAQHWATHATACSTYSVRVLIIQFLSNDQKVSNAARVLFYSPRSNAISYADEWRSDFRYSLSLAGSCMAGIHLIAFLGVEDIVLMLLNNGFSADIRDASQRSPLFWAAIGGHSKVVSLLLSLNNTDVNPELKYGRTFSTPLVDRDYKYGVPGLVLPENVDLENVDALANTMPALQVTECNNPAALSIPVVLKAVDVNCQDDRGYTPLIIAARRGHHEVVAQLLKEVGVLVNLVNDKGESPLLYAVFGGHEAIVELLIARADVDINLKPPFTNDWRLKSIQTEDGGVLLLSVDTVVGTGSDKCWTPLIAAAFYGHEGIVKLLLANHSVDVNCKDSDGRTALGVAARHGNEAIGKLLLDDRVDVGPVDNDGHTALSRAAYGWLERGWSKRPRTYENMAFTKHENMVGLLLTRRDIDVECVDNEGNNLLSRVTRYAEETPEPRLEGTIALLRAAMEDRSRAVSED